MNNEEKHKHYFSCRNGYKKCNGDKEQDFAHNPWSCRFDKLCAYCQNLYQRVQQFVIRLYTYLLLNLFLCHS